MHQPKPHGQLTVGAEPTDEDSAAVELLTRRLTNLKQLSGVESLRMVRALPDGGFVVAQDMGGTLRVITHKPLAESQPFSFDGLATDYVPMLFSGVITKAIVQRGAGVGMKLTEQARRRIANYDLSRLPAKEVSLQRFEIEYGRNFSEFLPKFDTPLVHTQYASLRPTWYSGAMAELMQIVGGYGRQRLGDLPDNALERARMVIPHQVLTKIKEQMGINVRLPGYSGLPHPKGEFQYDYKATRTDAVCFAGDQPWLVRLSSKGVWAMPLPLVPATQTAAFREYMEQVGDAEILAILDRFGGMPSGESFPDDEGAFQAWRRAGVIIKVCESGGFYEHYMYSTACGWALNSTGSEGFNTCYDYYDSGLSYGLSFKLKLKLGQATLGGKLPAGLKPSNPDEALRLDAYLSSLYRLMGEDKPEHLAIKYKLRRVPPADLLARASGEVGMAELNYWDAFTAAPIAQHQGRVSEVGRGNLFDGAKFEFQPQIKFPEPLESACISHDFLPAYPVNGAAEPNRAKVKCDTIMWGYYSDDQLKVIKYFRDGGSYKEDTQSDFEECMTVGSWTKVETKSTTAVLGRFYTTDFDDRKPIADSVEVTKIRGSDLGYGPIRWSFKDIISMRGWLWRHRYYTHVTNVTQTGGHWLEVALCIPYFCRSAHLYAYEDSSTGGSEREHNSIGSIQDPTSYRMWTYHFVTNWLDGAWPGSKGKPHPDDGVPLWVEFADYAPGGCSDFADQGPWIPSLPADYSWLRPPGTTGSGAEPGAVYPSINQYSWTKTLPGKQSGNLRFEILGNPVVLHRNIPDSGYFLSSPDLYGFKFYRDACHVTFGAISYANVSEAGSGGRAHWGNSTLVDHKSSYHFIGVINE
ncbi:MAG: hypothetical protein ACRC9H_10055 [Aeromonas veronii]